MTLQGAIDYIHAVGWGSTPCDLSRMKALLSLCGNPHRGLACIHIAGTNGKGSTSAMLDAIYTAAGYRVGLFTSPYLIKFNERVRVCGEPISDECLVALTERVKSAADQLPSSPTTFEVITAIGFLYFQEMQVDLAVIEVGLGGRLDPTNVLEHPTATLITGIDFDHTAYLGNTLSAIAKEKAGIIKEGVPVLLGEMEEEALQTIQAIAKERHAPVICTAPCDITVLSRTLDGTVMNTSEYQGLPLSLLGDYQPQNAALVLAAVKALQNTYPVDEAAVRRGLSSVRWPARFELLSRDPVTIYDGGHNPQGVRSAVASLKAYFPTSRAVIVMGVMTDKQYGEMVKTLASVAAHVFAVTVHTPRALPAAFLAEAFAKEGTPATACSDLEGAISAARELAKREDLPCLILGSLYLYGEIIGYFQ